MKLPVMLPVFPGRRGETAPYLLWGPLDGCGSARVGSTEADGDSKRRRSTMSKAHRGGTAIPGGWRFARGVLTGVVAMAAVAMGVILSPNGVPTASARAHAPAAPARALATCGWYNDISQHRPITGLNVAGKSVAVTYDVQIQSYRNTSTGAYCGQIQEHVCVTVASNFGWPSIGVAHQWYRNNVFINSRLQWIQVSGLGPFCSYSGSFAIPAGSRVLVAYKYYATNGDSGSQWFSLEDCCVG